MARMLFLCILLALALECELKGKKKNKKNKNKDLKVMLGTPDDIISFYDLRNETGQLQLVTEGFRQSRPPLRFPCSCQNGGCGCCVGMNIKGLSFNKRRTCYNLTYDPNDFALSANILMNDESLFFQRISARNPPPLCVPLPIPFIPIPKLCAKVFNMFTPGANFHLCFMFEALLGKKPLLRIKFDCLRVGINGLALLKPEDNGGNVGGGGGGGFGGLFGGGGDGGYGGGGGGHHHEHHDPVDYGGGGDGGGGGDYEQREDNSTISENEEEEESS